MVPLNTCLKDLIFLLFGEQVTLEAARLTTSLVNTILKQHLAFTCHTSGQGKRQKGDLSGLDIGAEVVGKVGSEGRGEEEAEWQGE